MLVFRCCAKLGVARLLMLEDVLIVDKLSITIVFYNDKGNCTNALGSSRSS
jgi:hypothetical protein